MFVPRELKRYLIPRRLNRTETNKRYIIKSRSAISMETGQAIVIAASIGVVGYFVKFYLEFRRLEYERKEQRYIGILKTMYGFYVGSEDKELKQKFINELNLAYLYASDDVIKSAQEFFETIKVKPVPSSDTEKKNALANLVMNMRKDLKMRTSLHASDFETWIPT